VQQVLMNLVLNAGEALINGRGRISLSIGTKTVAEDEAANYVTRAAPQAGDYVYLQVTDNG
jgi:signal transduction histidine kinase